EGGDRSVLKTGVAQRRAVGGKHGGEAAEALDQAFGRRLRILARYPGEEEKFEQLIIRKRRSTSFEQALPQALAMAKVIRLLVAGFAAALASPPLGHGDLTPRRAGDAGLWVRA